MPKVDFNLEVSYKFLEYEYEDDIIKEIDSIKTEKLDENCKNNECEYSKTKEKEEYKFICLKIDFKQKSESEYINYNIFYIEKLPQLLIIESSKIIKMEKYQKKIFEFKPNSLSKNNSIIIIYKIQILFQFNDYQYMEIPSKKIFIY